MIRLKTGNLLTEKAEALVNTVNCVGVMGKGIALQFKKAYPDNFKAYKKLCDAGQIYPGQMFVYDNGILIGPRYIINFPTKRHWRGKSQLEDIQIGLNALIQEITERDIKSVAIPPLGCGNGGLDWAVIKPMILKACEQIPEVEVTLFEPTNQPVSYGSEASPTSKKPPMTVSRALFIQLLERYGEPGYGLTKLEIQKLAYFLQEAGEPLKLRFEKNQFGPYADNLNHVLSAIDGHYIQGFGDRNTRSSISVTAEGHRLSKELLAKYPESLQRLERVSNLIFGFETPYGMEMLATIHWIASKENKEAGSHFQVTLEEVKQWSDRKKNLFQERHLYKAWQHLQSQNWLVPAAF